MVGSVTYHIRCIRVAPSIIAASYSDESMPEIAAMYTIVPQPAPFHMSVITIIGRNMLDVVRNGIFSPPIWTIRLLTMPVLVDSRLYSIDITITHDMKCGRYSMVCMVRL